MVRQAPFAAQIGQRCSKAIGTQPQRRIRQIAYGSVARLARHV